MKQAVTYVRFVLHVSSSALHHWEVVAFFHLRSFSCQVFPWRKYSTCINSVIFGCAYVCFLWIYFSLKPWKLSFYFLWYQQGHIYMQPIGPTFTSLNRVGCGLSFCPFAILFFFFLNPSLHFALQSVHVLLLHCTDPYHSIFLSLCLPRFLLFLSQERWCSEVLMIGSSLIIFSSIRPTSICRMAFKPSTAAFHMLMKCLSWVPQLGFYCPVTLFARHCALNLITYCLCLRRVDWLHSLSFRNSRHMLVFLLQMY